MKEKNLNILLADDDTDDCIFFKQALDELGIAVKFTVVNDGDELMKHLLKNTADLPDILFLDINMPRKNGTECLQEMKRHEELKAIAVVMFSTSNSWDTINQLFKSGSHVYIHKPSDFAQLKQVIQNALPLAAERGISKDPIKYVLNA
jgi:CheY-like chemotaxis protein